MFDNTVLIYDALADTLRRTISEISLPFTIEKCLDMLLHEKELVQEEKLTVTLNSRQSILSLMKSVGYWFIGAFDTYQI